MRAYNQTISSYELYHHGIKGMRWGIRRFQKKDGSLTPSGKKRYDDLENPAIKKKSKHRFNLEQKYRKAGMSKEEAETAAAKRIKKEKIIAGAAALTVAAATAYVINKNLKEKCDSIIKSGKTLQRIEMEDTGGKLFDQFYAAENRADKRKYAGLLGLNRRMQTGHAYLMKIGVDKDIKVAGRDKAISTFKKLYDSDVSFKKEVDSFANRNMGGKNVANGNVKKMYDNFNTWFVDKRDTDSVKKFLDALKSEGYSAIRDINDSKFSGYKAKNPLIVFDHKDKVSVKSVKEMTGNKVWLHFGETQVEELLKRNSWKAAGVAGLIALQDDTVDKYKANKSAKQRSFISEYKKEHPNTTLSNKEIIKLM